MIIIKRKNVKMIQGSDDEEERHRYKKLNLNDKLLNFQMTSLDV